MRLTSAESPPPPGIRGAVTGTEDVDGNAAAAVTVVVAAAVTGTFGLGKFCCSHSPAVLGTGASFSLRTRRKLRGDDFGDSGCGCGADGENIEVASRAASSDVLIFGGEAGVVADVGADMGGSFGCCFFRKPPVEKAGLRGGVEAQGDVGFEAGCGGGAGLGSFRDG